MERILLALLLSSNAFCQHNSNLINAIDGELAANQTTISKVLSKAAYMHLHSLTEFREIIKKYARPGKVGMIADDEPGANLFIIPSWFALDDTAIDYIEKLKAKNILITHIDPNQPTPGWKTIRVPFTVSREYGNVLRN
jgi:hypothetical protein